MDSKIEYTCPENITSFSQCKFPDGVTHVICRNNQIKSFQYLPGSVLVIHCDDNQITSFKYLPVGVRIIYCNYNQIKSFKHLPGSVEWISCGNNQITSFKYLHKNVYVIDCENNQIKSFEHISGDVRYISCENNQIKSFQYLPCYVFTIFCEHNPCYSELISKGLPQIHQENKDRINISNWKIGIEKLRYMRLNYIIHSLWERYWYDQRDTRGYSRACKHIASKNCPNGFLSMT